MMFTTGIWPNSTTPNPMCRSLESIYLGSEEDLFFLPSTSSSSSTCCSASREDFYWVPSPPTPSTCTFSRSYPLDSFTHFEQKQQQSTSFTKYSNLNDKKRRNRCSIGTQTAQEESEEHSLKEQCHSIAIQLLQLADEFQQEIEQRKQQKWTWSSLFAWRKALPEMPQENTTAGILLNLIASWIFSSAILPQ